MPISRIKAVTPIIVDGEQESFDGRFGTMYKFEIVFEDGTVGEINGKKEGEYTYAVGTEMEYTAKTDNRAIHETKISAKKPKKASYESETGGTTSSGSTYNDPVVVKQMAMGMAQLAAIETFKVYPDKVETNDDIHELAKKYYLWITVKGDVVDRDRCSRRWYSVQRAVECMKFEGLSIKSSNDVLKMAEYLYDKVAELS